MPLILKLFIYPILVCAKVNGVKNGTIPKKMYNHADDQGHSIFVGRERILREIL